MRRKRTCRILRENPFFLNKEIYYRVHAGENSDTDKTVSREKTYNTAALIFAQQLTGIDTSFMHRVMADRSHTLMSIFRKADDIMIGAILFRVFPEHFAVDIDFFAIRTEYQNNGYGTKALNALLRHLSTSLANVSAARESPDSIPISSIAHSYFQSPFTSALAYTLPDKKDSAGLHQLIDRATTTNHGSGTDKLEKNGSPIEIDGQGGLPLSMRMCEKDNTSADARKTMGAHQRVGGADTLCVFVAADIAAVSFFRKHGFAEMEHHQSAKTKQYTHTRTHAYTYARGDGGGLRSNMSVEGDDDDDDEDPIVATIAPINLNYLGYASNSESVGGNGGSSADMDTNDCDANRDPSHKSSHQSIAQINDQSHSSAQQSQPSLQQVDIKTVFPAILPVSQRRTLELTLGHLHRYDDAVPMYMLMHID